MKGGGVITTGKICRRGGVLLLLKNVTWSTNLKQLIYTYITWSFFDFCITIKIIAVLEGAGGICAE